MPFDQNTFLEVERRGNAPQHLQSVVEELRQRNKFPPPLQQLEQPKVYTPPEEPTKPSMSLVDTAIGAVKNAPNSLLNFTGDMVSAIISPIETASNTVELVSGMISKMARISGGYDQPEGLAKKEELFDKLMDFYGEKYNSFEDIKQGIAKDPMNYLSDLSVVFSLAGVALKGAGALSKVQKLSTAGRMVGKIGATLDPLHLTAKALKPLGTLGKKVIGTVLTGVGSEMFDLAGAASKDRKLFLDTLRGNIKYEDIITKTEGAIDKVRDVQVADYSSKLEAISKTKLNFADDLKKIRQAFFKKISKRPGYNVKLDPAAPNYIGQKSFQSSSARYSKDFADDVNKVADALVNWEKIDPLNLDAIGMDTLKQQMNSFYAGNKKSRAITVDVANQIKDVLVKKVPGYGTMISKYEKYEDLVNNIKDAISSKSQGGANTAIKKMTKLLREDNVFSVQVLEEMNKITGQNIIPILAGLSARPFTAQATIGRRVQEASMIIGLMGNVDAKLAIAAMMASPRPVAELFNVLGKVARGYKATQRAVGLTIPSTLSKMGQLEGIKNPPGQLQLPLLEN